MRVVQNLYRRYLQGRITSVDEWEKKVKKVCLKWLKKTPVVPSNDSKCFNAKKGKKSIQVWQVGSLIIALKESGENIDIEKILKDYDFADIKDADYGMLAYSFLGEDHFNNQTTAMLEYINNNQSADNIVYYKSSLKGSFFVDTLGFICPFLFRLGALTDKNEYIDLALKQIDWYFENGIEKHCNLPFHAVRVDKTTLGICDWGRGTAWFLIALADGFKELKKVGKENLLKERLILFADTLLTLQKGNGSYSWQLLSKRDGDSSATAVIGWFFANCYEIFNDEKYLTCARNCREYLMSVTFNNGIIDYCQGDTISVGNYSRLFDKMPFGQAFALRLQNVLRKTDKLEIV